MTERFVVPEPSDEAKGAYFSARGSLDNALAAAYAVDLPAIVQAEVVMALREVYTRFLGRGGSPGAFPWVRDYLTARYGAETETVKVTGMDAQGHATMERTAPTFTRETEAALVEVCTKLRHIGVTLRDDAINAYLASREGR